MALVEGMGEALLNSNLVDGKAQNCLQSDPEALTKSKETIANGIACLTGDSLVPRLLFTEWENSLVNCLCRFGSNILKSL